MHRASGYILGAYRYTSNIRHFNSYTPKLLQQSSLMESGMNENLSKKTPYLQNFLEQRAKIGLVICTKRSCTCILCFGRSPNPMVHSPVRFERGTIEQLCVCLKDKKLRWELYQSPLFFIPQERQPKASAN